MPPIRMRCRPRAHTLLLTLAAVAFPALAVPDYDFDWVTIGDPGNAAYIRDDFGDFFDGPIGSVGYAYRMAKTEVTNSQWAEFVTAYRPYWTGNPNAYLLTGGDVFTNDAGQTYQAFVGWENVASGISWPLAAVYCNWLHNGKASDRSAFESGAYDTSGWSWDQNNPNFFYAPSLERSPGARFWIPNEDEWTKAAFYDPNRYGEGEGGYWQYIGGSDEWLLQDETSSGNPNSFPPEPVGSYPDVSSPWGLLDLSGGQREWVEDTYNTGTAILFHARGSRAGDFSWMATDRIDYTPLQHLGGFHEGLRLASAVPTPGTALVLAAAGTFPVRRRRGSRSEDRAG